MLCSAVVIIILCLDGLIVCQYRSAVFVLSAWTSISVGGPLFLVCAHILEKRTVSSALLFLLLHCIFMD